jgi:hypothetical protein
MKVTVYYANSMAPDGITSRVFEGVKDMHFIGEGIIARADPIPEKDGQKVLWINRTALFVEIENP